MLKFVDTRIQYFFPYTPPSSHSAASPSMPKYFHFHREDEHFNAPLQCQRCAFIRANGQQCKRSVCVGLTMCNTHLPIKYHVRIGKSTILGGGHGLFAHLPGAASGDIVFRKGDTIATYEGGLISQVERARRYGWYTAPYGLHLNARESIDAALQRTVGSLANHYTRIDRTNTRLSVDARNKKGEL